MFDGIQRTERAGDGACGGRSEPADGQGHQNAPQVGMAGFVHFVEHLAGVFRRTNVHRLHAGRASTGYFDFLADHHGVIRHHVLRIFRGLVDVGFLAFAGGGRRGPECGHLMP